jgi:predicted nucleotidyltransferase
VPLPEPVRQVTGHYLALLEERAPGLVDGVYLVGSLGFGEWYEGRSDVDFVAVTRDRPDGADAARLRRVHDQVGDAFPRPYLSGSYVTWGDLARSPALLPDVPGILEGEWRDSGPGPSPVEWHELAHHGVRLHGPALADGPVHADTAELRAYSHSNLSEYWEPNLARLAEHREAASRPDLVEWFVLGIPRLHHAIATGTLTSKDGAGHYALEVFGAQRWRPVVAEALTHRALGEPSGMWSGRESELADEVLTFCGLALASSLALDPTDESP